MDARSIGLYRPIREIEPGQCILFSYKNYAGLGMIVNLRENDHGILHFGARKNEIQTPSIYKLEYFEDEPAIHIIDARIVPVLALEHVRFGRPAGRIASLAFYISSDAIMIGANFGHTVSGVNLFSSLLTNLATSQIISIIPFPVDEFGLKPAQPSLRGEAEAIQGQRPDVRVLALDCFATLAMTRKAPRRSIGNHIKACFIEVPDAIGGFETFQEFMVGSIYFVIFSE